ncbi:Family of unknown function (DUF5314) [Nakaseomyces glabratus]|nr:Family of unknown function (DUF5314) [Nakaseomyces glabratus]
MSLEKKLVYPWVAEIDGSDTSAIFEEIRNPAICEFKTFILSEVGDFQIWIERFEDIILLTNMYWYRFYKAGPYYKEGITDIYERHVISNFDNAMIQLVLKTVSAKVRELCDSYLQFGAHHKQVTVFGLIDQIRSHYDRDNPLITYKRYYAWLGHMSNISNVERELDIRRLITDLLDDMPVMEPSDKLSFEEQANKRAEISKYKNDIIAYMTIATTPNITADGITRALREKFGDF